MKGLIKKGNMIIVEIGKEKEKLTDLRGDKIGKGRERWRVFKGGNFRG